MSRALFHRRGPALATLTSLTGLSLIAAAAWVPTAQAAPPAEDCAVPFPVSSLAAGTVVNGLTVSKGTAPDGFTGEVLGVIDNGIGPDVDMVIARLSSSEINRVGGIWQGMSGSPVYAPDGRLIGAVSYGLSAGPSPVAGITPFEDMDDYLNAPAAARVKPGPKTLRAITERTDVNRREARQGFSQLRMPWGVSGVRADRLAQIKRSVKRPWLRKDTYSLGAAAAPGAGAGAPGPESIIAGGNLAGSASYGDVTQAGVGTATSVCQGKVVGFGHPLGFLGKTSLTLHPASAIYVQEDPTLTAFKVANVGAPAGTIADDHLAGITGTFGAAPPTTKITSTVAYGRRSRTGSTQVSVPDFIADTTFYQVVGNHDSVLDGKTKGSELSSWTVRGTDQKGRTFALQATDRHQSTDNISMAAGLELSDFVYGLTTLAGVSLESVEMSSAVTDSTDTWKVSGVAQRRNQAWVKLTKKNPAQVQAGKKLRVRAVLKGPGGTKMVRVAYRVPKRAAGTRAVLQMLGGDSVYTDPSFKSIAKARQVLAATARNDVVVAEFATRDDISQQIMDSDDSFFGFFRRGPSKALAFDRVKRLGPTDRVVTGSRKVRVRIR